MRKLSKLLAVMVITFGFISLTMVTGASAKDIKVGAVINLTGPLSSWGQYHAKGLQDYMRYVNEVKGGIDVSSGSAHGADRVYLLLRTDWQASRYLI